MLDFLSGCHHIAVLRLCHIAKACSSFPAFMFRPHSRKRHVCPNQAEFVCLILALEEIGKQLRPSRLKHYSDVERKVSL